MTRLVFGVLLWSVVHLSLAIMVDLRKNLINRMGENPYKGVFAPYAGRERERAVYITCRQNQPGNTQAPGCAGNSLWFVGRFACREKQMTRTTSI